MKNYTFVYFFTFLWCTVAQELELLWVVDDSYSISKLNYDNIKIFINDVNTNLTIKTKFGIVEFGTRAEDISPLSYNYSKFVESLQKSKFGGAGDTRISSIIKYINNNLIDHKKYEFTTRLIVMITDGVPTPWEKYGAKYIKPNLYYSFRNCSLDRFIYVMVENNIGGTSPRPEQFSMITPYYNQSTDFISFNFGSIINESQISKMSQMIYNTVPVTHFPSKTPTKSPSLSPTLIPSTKPSVSPSINPTTNHPTLKPNYYRDITISPSMSPIGKYQNPTKVPTEGTGAGEPKLSTGALVGIVVGGLVGVIFIIVACVIVYTYGIERNK